MKNYKLSKSVQIVLISLLLVVVGIIIVGLMTNNRVNASATAECPKCGSTSYLTGENNEDNTQHQFECGDTSCEVGTFYENHSGGSHENYGKCTICDVKYLEHGIGAIREYVYDGVYEGEHVHKAVHECEDQSCDLLYYGITPYACTGGCHENGGKCEDCNETYQNHGNLVGEYIYVKVDNDFHEVYYKCEYEDCKDPALKNPAESHSGGEHPDGICGVCDQVYQVHGIGDFLKYNITKDNHTPIYDCLGSACAETVEGATVAHTGGEENDGYCITCEYPYMHTEDPNFDLFCTECRRCYGTRYKRY